MAERLINASEDVLADLTKKAEVSKEKVDELEDATKDMKRILKELEEPNGT